MGLKTKLVKALGSSKRQCPTCWKVLPADGSYCLDCGSSLRKAVAMPEEAATVVFESVEGAFRETQDGPADPVLLPTIRCPHCSASSPHGARYCVSCGKAVAARRQGSDTAPIGGFDLA